MIDGHDGVDDMKQTLQIWRRNHPNAPFAKMERAVEEELAQVRSQMLTELAGAQGERLHVCPQCGRRMQRREERNGALEIPGGIPVELTRGHHVCPHCSLGRFPPGRDPGPAPR
jgi:rubrerythrin